MEGKKNVCIVFIHACFWQYTLLNICVTAYKHAANKQAEATDVTLTAQYYTVVRLKKKLTYFFWGGDPHQEQLHC